MAFFWWGNILAIIWAFITMWTGIRFADGNTSGPMSWYGSLFDRMFGLDTCRKVPSHNQNITKDQPPCYSCKGGASYAHADNSGFRVTYPIPPNVSDCVVIDGVGGYSSRNISGSGKPVDPVSYINKVITGSPTGSIPKNDYDTKRFKFGTPYIDRQTSTTDAGYYFSTDAKGQEVPIILPYTGGSGIPASFGPASGFPTDGSTGLPIGWNAYVRDSRGDAITAITGQASASTQLNPNSAYTFDSVTGFPVVPGVNYNNNAWYVSGPLSNTQEIQYKKFTSTAAPISEWSKRR